MFIYLCDMYASKRLRCWVKRILKAVFCALVQGRVGFSGDSAVKNLPTMQETWIWSLGWEEPLEEGTGTHSSILAWRIPWTEESGRLQSMGSQRIGHDWSEWACTHIGQSTIASWKQPRYMITTEHVFVMEPNILFFPLILLGLCTANKHMSINSNVQIILTDHIWVHSSLDFHILISKHVVFLIHEVWYHNNITNFKEESCRIYNFLRTLFYLKNILLQKKYILTVMKTNKQNRMEVFWGMRCFYFY